MLFYVRNLVLAFFLSFHKLYHTHSKETVVSLNRCINDPSIVSQIVIIRNVAVQLIIVIIIFFYPGKYL